MCQNFGPQLPTPVVKVKQWCFLAKDSEAEQAAGFVRIHCLSVFVEEQHSFRARYGLDGLVAWAQPLLFEWTHVFHFQIVDSVNSLIWELQISI